MNGLMMKLDIPSNRDDPITVHYNDYSEGGKVGVPKSMEVDLVIGADGANSRVAKDIDAGECDYAIAFQVRRPSTSKGDDLAAHAALGFNAPVSILAFVFEPVCVDAWLRPVKPIPVLSCVLRSASVSPTTR